MSSFPPPHSLPDLILRSLWGNRADLSLSGGKVEHHAADEVVAERASAAADKDEDKGEEKDKDASLLLWDDSDRAVRRLERALVREHGRVVFVVDNCGLELLCDLALIDSLLFADAAGARTSIVVDLVCKVR